MPKRAYYYHHDFFTMSNDEELTILQNFKTFQQTENYTCGPVCVQMILEYYKDKVPTEEELKKELKSKKKKGTEIVNIVNFFKKKKYEIDCSLTRKRNKEGYIFKPACGRVGEKISIKEACKDDEYEKILADVKKHPKQYIAQKKFNSKPLITDEGQSFHLCLGSYSVEGKHAGYYARISKLPRIDSFSADIPVLIEGEENDR